VEKKELLFFVRGISKFCKAKFKSQQCYLSGMSVLNVQIQVLYQYILSDKKCVTALLSVPA